MAQIIDLNLFDGEPLVIKGLDGKEYNIPYTIPTGFTIKLMKHYDDIGKLKSNEKAVHMMKEIVLDILNLDATQDINMEYLNRYFDDLRILKLIIEETIKHIKTISNQKNLNSPEPA